MELFGCTDPDSWDSLTYTLKIDGSGTLPSCLSFNDTPNGDNKLILTYTDCTTPTTYSGELKCEDDNLHSYDNNK